MNESGTYLQASDYGIRYDKRSRMNQIRENKTFGDKVIAFSKHLTFSGPLPQGIRVMNPVAENPVIPDILEKFYHKFYPDFRERKLILGINPGRFGAGTTGIPFTDTKRLKEVCRIPIDTPPTHEPSSAFMYEMFDRLGGLEKFCRTFYISAICPLGFLKVNSKGNWVNYNYYDSKELFYSVKGFIRESLLKTMEFGINPGTCFILGKKNAQFFHQINQELHLFDDYRVLEHPRYIVQYKSRQKEDYLEKYAAALG